MLITMSEKDIQRFKVLTDVREKRLRQVDAAVILNLSARHIRRLVNKLVSLGAQSLTHAARGRPSNRRYSEYFRIEILKLIREHYSDFSPTFALEKLTERHNLSVSKETLRQWMIADGLWLPHSQRKPRVYQPRYRRDCLGELIQIDGSHHDWFEGRSDKCCLLVFIDDICDFPIWRVKQCVKFAFNKGWITSKQPRETYTGKDNLQKWRGLASIKRVTDAYFHDIGIFEQYKEAKTASKRWLKTFANRIGRPVKYIHTPMTLLRRRR
ncbi:hypothetical protein VCRA2113O324_40218 [Vibrio crassostreae]|nr:hypothetical protein EDB58_101209 [Vibrio crassostreae]RPF53632.1 hypothetical protein EDB61_1101 [Vibrio crassostreae]CAK2135286.1 hypothetical protein VCRA2113O324_40218 [Vibrio crassostreae]CAK2158407.1 hypothetical protein VCRA2111O320_40217 [Vibrio crassostreae]CAK3001907.1 hypothetical protein VCRA2121O336_40092 [Vibrio crassostreae]